MPHPAITTGSRNILIGSGPSNEGVWHRAVMVAQALYDAGRWNGIDLLELHYPYQLHQDLFGFKQVDPASLVEGRDFDIRPGSSERTNAMHTQRPNSGPLAAGHARPAPDAEVDSESLPGTPAESDTAPSLVLGDKHFRREGVKEDGTGDWVYRHVNADTLVCSSPFIPVDDEQLCIALDGQWASQADQEANRLIVSATPVANGEMEHAVVEALRRDNAALTTQIEQLTATRARARRRAAHFRTLWLDRVLHPRITARGLGTTQEALLRQSLQTGLKALSDAGIVQQPTLAKGIQVLARRYEGACELAEQNSRQVQDALNKIDDLQTQADRAEALQADNDALRQENADLRTTLKIAQAMDPAGDIANDTRRLGTITEAHQWLDRHNVPSGPLPQRFDALDKVLARKDARESTDPKATRRSGESSPSQGTADDAPAESTTPSS